MGTRWQKFFNVAITVLLIFQTGCGTLLYPERRNQVPGRLDVGIVILDGIGLLFVLIPGIIAFAVDFGDGCIYLPARHPVITTADLRTIKFDPKHTTLAQLEKIIKDQTGQSVHLAQGNVQIIRMKSGKEMMQKFAQAGELITPTRLALN